LALRFNDYTGEHLREILPLVNHENPLIRYRAASLMATHLQPEDTPVLISIVEAAQHPDPAVRSFIARALGKCTQNDAARIVLPPLRRALTDSSMQVCMNAAGSLATIDTNAMHVLTDCDLAVRVHGATVFLHKIDPKSTQAVRELVAALTDRDSDLRSSDPGRRISAKAAVAGAERWLSLSVRQNPNVAALLTKMALEDPDREIQIVARKLLDQASPDGVRSQRGSE
jgi:HEAT repeat protein